MTKILRGSKTVYKSFVNVNGTWKYDATSFISQYDPDKRKIKFLMDYLDFIMYSGILSPVTKIWFDSIESSPTEAIRHYNENQIEKEKIPMKKVNNHIYYDGKRLLEYFPDDMLINIILDRGDMDVYEAQLKCAVDKKSGNSVLKERIALDMPMGMMKERPDECDILSFFALITPYSKKRMKAVEAEIPMNVVMYINYIANKTTRTKDEEAIMQRLENIDEDDDWGIK